MQERRAEPGRAGTTERFSWPRPAVPVGYGTASLAGVRQSGVTGVCPAHARLNPSAAPACPRVSESTCGSGLLRPGCRCAIATSISPLTPYVRFLVGTGTRNSDEAVPCPLVMPRSRPGSARGEQSWASSAAAERRTGALRPRSCREERRAGQACGPAGAGDGAAGRGAARGQPAMAARGGWCGAGRGRRRFARAQPCSAASVGSPREQLDHSLRNPRPLIPLSPRIPPNVRQAREGETRSANQAL